MIGILSLEDSKELLRSNILGRIGCFDGKRSYIVPINYVFDGKFILAHSVLGLKIQILRKNPNLCFEVDEVKQMNDWKSVIVWGEYQELTDERDRYAAMKLFVEKTMYMKVSETAIPPEIVDHRVHPRSAGNIRPVVYRILIEEISGRFEKSS